MKLRVVRTESKKLSEWSRREWRIADREHYGAQPHWNWRGDDEIVVAYDGTRIIGRAKMHAQAGVGEVKTVIVGKDAQSRGVGTALMRKLEAIARAQKLHKLWLVTGEGWKAVEFYKKLGYKKEGYLPKHFAKVDFILMSKFLRK